MKILFGLIVYITIAYTQINTYFLKQISCNDSLLFSNLQVFKGHAISPKEIHDLIDSRLKDDEEEGRLFSRATINGFYTFTDNDGRNCLELVVTYTRGDKVRLDSLIFNGGKGLEAHLLRESRLNKNDIFTPEMLMDSEQFLSRSAYLSSVSKGRIIALRNNKYAVSFDVIPLDVFWFNGIVGYAPGQTDTWSSDIELNYENILNSGKKVHFNWKKPNNRSEDINVSYFQPWVLGLPVHADIELSKLFRDSSYTNFSIGGGIKVPLSSNLELGTGLTYSLRIPVDSLVAQQQSLPVNEHYETRFFLHYENLNRRINPQKGISTKLAFSGIRSEAIRPDWLLNRLHLKKTTKVTVSLDFNAYVPFYTSSVLATKLRGKVIDGNQLYESDYYYFGGAKSLRGFNELTFKSYDYALLGIEYRYLIGTHSRLYTFIDGGVFDLRHKETLNVSWGVGVRFKTTYGMLGVDFAIPSGSNFSESKIHFGIFSPFE